MGLCMAHTKTVQDTVEKLRTAPIPLLLFVDWEVGTVTVKDGDTIVYRALQKGADGPWIVRFSRSENVQWE